MILETVKEEDMPHLCVLFNEARAGNLSFPKTEYGIEEFLKFVEGERIVVARIDGDIVGFAAIWEPENFLHHLYVSPKYQRQGVGSTLLKYCISQCGLPMSLKCIEANSAANRFYEKHGWRVAEQAEGPEGRYFLYVRESIA